MGRKRKDSQPLAPCLQTGAGRSARPPAARPLPARRPPATLPASMPLSPLPRPSRRSFASFHLPGMVGVVPLGFGGLRELFPSYSMLVADNLKRVRAWSLPLGTGPRAPKSTGTRNPCHSLFAGIDRLCLAALDPLETELETETRFQARRFSVGCCAGALLVLCVLGNQTLASERDAMRRELRLLCSPPASRHPPPPCPALPRPQVPPP